MTSEHDIRPTGDNVLLEIERDEHRSAAGLYLGWGVERPDLLRGRVLCVGPGRRITRGPRSGERIPVQLREGDRVLVPKECGFSRGRLNQPGQAELLLVRESMIECVIGETTVKK